MACADFECSFFFPFDCPVAFRGRSQEAQSPHTCNADNDAKATPSVPPCQAIIIGVNKSTNSRSGPGARGEAGVASSSAAAASSEEIAQANLLSLGHDAFGAVLYWMGVGIGGSI